VREVLAARSGRDFTVASAPRNRRTRARPSIARAVLTFVIRRPGRLLGGLLFAATAGFISVNALTLQPAPHPAPLFGKTERSQFERGLATPQPAPANRSVETAPQRQPTQPAVPMSIEDVLAPVPPSRPVNETASIPSDPIGDLLRSGAPSSSTAQPVANSPEPDLRVMAAQRALTKLGYGPLTDDGLFGPMTRTAIERFQREQGIEVTGVLAAQTARALSVRSGIIID